MEKKAGNLLPYKVADGIVLSGYAHRTHKGLFTSEEVAQGYAVSRAAIRNYLYRRGEEFIEGKHYLSGMPKGVTDSDTLGNEQPHTIYWTVRGILRLGFFVKSDVGRLLRDWAEGVLLGEIPHHGRRSEPRMFALDRQLLAKVQQYLRLGDVKRVAVQLGVTAKHVSKVKNGRSTSHRVMAALVQQAVANKKAGTWNKAAYEPRFATGQMELFIDPKNN